jgi:ketosteroid isomerase-like protein
MFEAFNDGRIEDLLAMIHPSAVFEPVTRPGRTVYIGHEGVLDLISDIRRTPSQGRVRFDAFTKLPDGRVEARGHQIVATDDGEVMGQRVSPVITVNDGLVVRLESW